MNHPSNRAERLRKKYEKENKEGKGSSLKRSSPPRRAVIARLKEEETIAEIRTLGGG